jgi:hypothetical protein
MPEMSDVKVELFLKQVRERLRGLGEDEISDILQELRSHILDRVKVTADLPKLAVATAIESLGSPEEIASEYMTAYLIARARVTRTPWAVFRVIVRWASLSVGGFIALIISVCGYSLGSIFLLCAILKPFDPEGVGLWIQRDPFALSLLVGAPDQGSKAHEVLGWWIIPVGIIVAMGLLILTTKFGLWSVLRFQRSRKTISVKEN